MVFRATVRDVRQKEKQERKQVRKRRGPAWLALGMEPVSKTRPAEWDRGSALSTVRGTPARLLRSLQQPRPSVLRREALLCHVLHQPFS